MAQVDYDVIIVGGGIAGLAAAWELRERNILLLEASEAPSGRIRSAHRDGYWVNLGAQFLGGEGPLYGYMDHLGIEALPIENALPAIAVKGKVVASGSPLGFVLRLPLSLAGRFDMARVGIRMTRAYSRLFNNSNRDDASRFRRQLDQVSIGQFLRAKDPLVGEILRTFVRIFTAAEPEEVSAERAIVFVGLGTKLAGGIPPMFLPRGGNQRVPLALAEALGDRVRVRADVTAVTPEEGAVRVTFRDGGSEVDLTGRRCIMAVPAYAVGQIIKELDEERSNALAGIHYGAILAVGMFTKELERMPWNDFFSVAVAGKAFQTIMNHGIVVRDNQPAKEVRGALTVYAAGDPARQLMDRPDDEIKEIFSRDLYDLFPSARGIVAEMFVKRWPHALPYWKPGGTRTGDLLRRPTGNVHFAGDYQDYPSMQTAAASGVAAATAVAERLDSTG